MRKKIPWGIFCGIAAMFVFYLTLAFVLVYVIFSNVAKQTNSDFSPFQYGWQVAIFVFDLIFIAAFVVSLVFYIRGKKQEKKDEEGKEPIDATQENNS